MQQADGEAGARERVALAHAFMRGDVGLPSMRVPAAGQRGAIA